MTPRWRGRNRGSQPIGIPFFLNYQFKCGIDLPEILTEEIGIIYISSAYELKFRHYLRATLIVIVLYCLLSLPITISTLSGLLGTEAVEEVQLIWSTFQGIGDDFQQKYMMRSKALASSFLWFVGSNKLLYRIVDRT